MICRLVRAHQLTFSAAFGFSRSRLWWPLALGIAGALLAMPVVLSLGYVWGKLLTFCHVRVETQLPVQMLQGSASLEARVLIGAVAIFIAPVVEEMLFRGVLYATLKRNGFRRAAVWGTAFLFAGVHLNLMTFVPLTVLAVVLAWLYEATDNLLAPIVAHGFFNLVNYFLVSPLIFDGSAPAP
jgi:membrane protease YdiL (CAAX protease family)